jgi:hypothetical protein
VRQSFREMVIGLADGNLSPKKVLCMHRLITPAEGTLTFYRISKHLATFR